MLVMNATVHRPCPFVAPRLSCCCTAPSGDVLCYAGGGGKLLERLLKSVSPGADAVDIGLVATAMTAVVTAILICSQLP